MGLLSGLSSQGRTILVVTHDHNVAAYAGRRLSMRDGKLYEESHRPQVDTARHGYRGAGRQDLKRVHHDVD
jgi:ABC-type lipoprotein export system ATPase subunit